MRKLILALSILGGMVANASWAGEFDGEPGSFASFEAGKLILLSDRNKATDPILLYFNIGFPLSAVSPNTSMFTMGPKFGVGFGNRKTVGPAIAENYLFLEGTGNFRYASPKMKNILRLYLEGGPGVTTYINTALQLEGGAGLDIFFSPQSSIGLSAHYREILFSDVARGVSVLGTLTYFY